MGTWGTGIFSDDLASDIRDQFRESIGDGQTTEAATNQILADYAGTIDDEDEGPTFWIALAATQMQCGRLLDRIRDRAVTLIDRGGDLARWEDDGVDPKDRTRRLTVLGKLRDALLGPPRPPTRIRKVYHDRTVWKVGHAISYRLKSGRFVIMRVLGIDKSGKSRIPIVELCDWTGREIPSPKEIQKLARRQTKFYRMNGTFNYRSKDDHKFTVYANSPRDFPTDRVAVVATGLHVKRTDVIGASFFGGWKALDEHLANDYGIR